MRGTKTQDADDPAADVFIAVAEGCSLSELRGTLLLWALTVAYRRLADLCRRAGRRRTEPIEPAVIAEHAPVGDAERNVMLAIGTRSALVRIAALPAAPAEVILLRVVADLR